MNALIYIALLQIATHDSSYSLSSITSGVSCGTTLQHSEELLERKEVISITGYVQKFVAAISELKKALEAEEGGDKDINVFVCINVFIHTASFCF